MAAKIIGNLSKILIASLEEQENKNISFEFETAITDRDVYPCKKYTFMYVLYIMRIPYNVIVIHSGHSIRLQWKWFSKSYFSSVVSGSFHTHTSNVCSYMCDSASMNMQIITCYGYNIDMHRLVKIDHIDYALIVTESDYIVHSLSSVYREQCL